MNKHDADCMKGYSIGTDRCVFCGRPTTNRHHVVFRSQGGEKGPTFAVCGNGNTSGCHGLLHHRNLHVRFNVEQDTWEFKKTGYPVKDEVADLLPNWIKMWRFTRVNAAWKR